jgi:hypothetical protein
MTKVFGVTPLLEHFSPTPRRGPCEGVGFAYGTRAANFWSGTAQKNVGQSRARRPGAIQKEGVPNNLRAIVSLPDKVHVHPIKNDGTEYFTNQ